MAYIIDRDAMVASLQQLEATKGPEETRQAFERVLSTPAFLRQQNTYSPATQFVERLRRQEDELTAVRRRLNPNDPDIKGIEAQVAQTERDIESTVRNFINGTTEQVRCVDRRIAEPRGSVKALPMQDVEHQPLSRAQKVVEGIIMQV